MAGLCFEKDRMNKIIRIKAGILNPDPRSLPAQLNFSEKSSRANLTGEPWPRGSDALKK